MNLKNRDVLLKVQAGLTVFGAALALYNLVTTLGNSPSLISVFFAVAYLVAHLVLIGYATALYQRKEDFPFQMTVYAYLALLGIQILQNGQFMPSLGLSEGLVLFVNTANLVAFANVIRFSDRLSNKRIASSYLLIAVVLKLLAELSLIVMLFSAVRPAQVLMSLSVPLLGATILIAYLNRIERLSPRN